MKHCILFTALLMMGCTVQQSHRNSLEPLRDSLQALADSVPGEVGIAVIVESNDTLTVGNENIYPLMSVMKLHQAVALCRDFAAANRQLDTVLTLDPSLLDRHTWSPMLGKYGDEPFDISVGELLRYALVESDNNASNVLFDRFMSIEATDSIMALLLPRDGFQLKWREADMKAEHSRSYDNRSTPMSAALLLEQLFTDSIMAVAYQQVICDDLRDCSTGSDRISAPLKGLKGVKVAHKTGSGYVDAHGRLIAHNDAAFVELPDGHHYTIVVFVKDMQADERAASAVISAVSEQTYRFISNLK